MTDVAPQNVPFTIDNIKQTTELDAQGDVIDVYAIRWSSPNLGSFTTSIPEKDFSPTEAHSILQEKANALGHLYDINRSGHNAS